MSLALTLSHQVERGYGGSRLTTDDSVRSDPPPDVLPAVGPFPGV